MIQIEKCDFGDSRVEAFTLLRGESSATDPYSGNSVCDYIGDEPNHVATARAALASMLGIDTADIITPHQTHSSNVAVIPPEGEMPSLDGVLSTSSNWHDQSIVAAIINTKDNLAFI